MLRWTLAVVMVLLVVPEALLADRQSPPDPVRFRAAFDEAWHLVRLGRKLEGRALLGNLAWRLPQFEPETRYRFSESLAEALNSLADPEGADRVYQTLVDTCVFEVTRSRVAVEDLPRDPKSRGLELCRLALTLPSTAPQRRMLMRGAMGSLQRVTDPTTQTQHRLGLCFLELGDRPRALELLRAAVAMDPGSAGPRIALARLVLAEGKAAEALTVLEKGLERGLDREGTELLAEVASAVAAAGDGARARAAAKTWSERSTDGRVMAPVWSLAAAFAEKDGRTQEALDTYCRVLEAEVKDPIVTATVRVARAQVARGAAERHAAVVALTRVVKPDGMAHPELLRVTGELALRDNDPLTAIKLYGSGLASTRTKPTFEPLLTELRQSFRASKKHDLAAEVDLAFGPPKFSEPDKGYAIVQMGDTACAVDVAGGTIAGKLPAKPQLAQFATTIAQVLKEYPPQLVQKLRLWKFELTEAPIVAGASWIGVADPENVTVHVNIKTPVTGPDDWRVALHHELFHLIDMQDDGITGKDTAWRNLNRAGFLYTHNKNVPCEPVTSVTGPEVPGFVNTYATSGAEEDKAVTFANMMVHIGVVEERASRDAIILAKMERIKRMAKQYLPTMDDTFWDAVRARINATAVAAAPAGN